LDDDDELDCAFGSMIVTKKSHNLRSEMSIGNKKVNNKKKKKWSESDSSDESDDNDDEYPAPRNDTPFSNQSDRSLRSGDTVLRSNRRLFKDFEMSPQKSPTQKKKTPEKQFY
jgi:hypothetical protein